MNISKIKEWLSSKPLWLKIVVTIVCVALLGLGSWFGLQSCASVSVDKFNVNTDEVQVDVEGVNIDPKEVSLSYDDHYFVIYEV